VPFFAVLFLINPVLVSKECPKWSKNTEWWH